MLLCSAVLANGAIMVDSTISITTHGETTKLNGILVAPDTAVNKGPYPAVSLLPGGGAPANSVQWAAELLAADGYIVVITKPSSGASLAAYNTAARSGIDYLCSFDNPYRSKTDTSKVGAAGWSLGARALSRTQEEDARLDAIVGWDNLAVSETGDAGSPSCVNSPNPVRTPKVPAMGQASEFCPDAAANSKTTAWRWWRENSIATAQVVFKGATHFWWGTAGTDANHALSHYYTLAWFDRWLKEDRSATSRLVSRTVNGRDVTSIISTMFQSAMFIDGYDCNDILASCPDGSTTVKQVYPVVKRADEDNLDVFSITGRKLLKSTNASNIAVAIQVRVSANGKPFISTNAFR